MQFVKFIQGFIGMVQWKEVSEWEWKAQGYLYRLNEDILQTVTQFEKIFI